MKWCDEFRLGSVLLASLCLLIANGCSDSPDKIEPGKASSAVSKDVDGDAAPNGDASTDGAPSSTSSDPTLDMAMRRAGYSPVFEKDLEQNLISKRMENNWLVYFQRADQSKMHHFKSAGLKMFKPDSLEIAKNYTGLAKQGAGITILTNPFSMAETTKNIINTVVNSPNSGLLFTKDIEIDGYQGTFYVNVEAYGEETRVANYTLAVGDDEFSWVAKGSFDAKSEMENKTGEDILRSLLSLRIADEPRLPPGQDVDFTIKPNVLKLNDGFVDKLIYTKGGTFPMDSIDQPIFQAIRVPKKVRPADQLEFAQLMITPTPIFKVELISVQDEVEIDSLKGYEYIAIGQDNVSGESLQLYSVTLYDNNVAYVMNGWVSSQNMDNHVQDFKELARSFRRKNRSSVNSDTTTEDIKQPQTESPKTEAAETGSESVDAPHEDDSDDSE